MPRHTDFLIIGSGIAGLRAATDLALAGDVRALELLADRAEHGKRLFALGNRHCPGAPFNPPTQSPTCRRFSKTGSWTRRGSWPGFFT